MLHRCLRPAAALVLATCAGPVLASVITLSGSLGDPGNTALVASDLGAAQFTDDLAMANNVALYALHVAVAGNVSFSSQGFLPGGIDPYFTLFGGLDRATATFLDSNFLNATTVGGDFTQDLLLAAGDYTVAIGVFENMSYAENQGTGVLADGFTGLGGPPYYGDGSYRFAITLPDTVNVPEPGTSLLGLTAAWAAWATSRTRRRQRPLPLTTHGER